MPWYAAAVVSSLCIMVVEYVNRHTDGGFIDALPYTVVPIVLAQWCLFHAWSGAPHWLTAWAVFAVGSSMMRVVAVHLFAGHEVSSWPFITAGITVMLVGSQLVKEGLR